MAIYATAGMKIFVGSIINDPGRDLTEADFAGEQWVEIGETESIGGLGDIAEEVTFQGVGQGRVKRLKGPRAAPPLDLVCGIDYADPGQIAMIAAEKRPDDYRFKFEFNDAPEGGTPSTRLFIGKVASANEQFDTAANVMKVNFSTWVNSNVVRIDAAVT